MLLCSHSNGETATKLMHRLEEQNQKPFIVERAMEPNAMEKLQALSEKMNNG